MFTMKEFLDLYSQYSNRLFLDLWKFIFAYRRPCKEIVELVESQHYSVHSCKILNFIRICDVVKCCDIDTIEYVSKKLGIKLEPIKDYDNNDNYDDPIFDLFRYDSFEVIKYYIDLGLDIFYKRYLTSDSLFDVLIKRKMVDLVFDTLSVLPDSELEKHSYVKLPINVLIKACRKRQKNDHVAKNA